MRFSSYLFTFLVMLSVVVSAVQPVKVELGDLVKLPGGSIGVVINPMNERHNVNAVKFKGDLEPLGRNMISIPLKDVEPTSIDGKSKSELSKKKLLDHFEELQNLKYTGKTKKKSKSARNRRKAPNSHGPSLPLGSPGLNPPSQPQPVSHVTQDPSNHHSHTSHTSNPSKPRSNRGTPPPSTPHSNPSAFRSNSGSPIPDDVWKVGDEENGFQ